MESISVGVLAVDLEDRIESWNSQMEVMYALPRARGRRPAAERGVAGRISGRILPRAARRRESTISTSSGWKRPPATPAPPTSPSRRWSRKDFSVIGRLIIVDDITERIELESQLSQAEKLSSIGLLAAGVAHEVNTPLAVISSYAQMLAKQVHGDEKQSALLEKITRQTLPRLGDREQPAELLAHLGHGVHATST